MTPRALAFPALALAALCAVLVLTTSAQPVPRVAVVGGLALICFAMRLLPELVTALLCFLAFLALGVAPAEVIFSGLTTGGFWLLFSGLVIGAAITGTGLGKRFAEAIHRRTGTSYIRATAMLTLGGLALGLLVPSTIPRVIVMMPVAVALSGAMGFATGSRGQIGLAMAAATSTLLPTYAILTANLPTIVQYGAYEALYGTQPTYGGYFLAQLPVNLVRLALLLALLLPFARGTLSDAAPAPAAAEPLTPPQRRLLLLLGVAIAAWATDGLHGISPAWVALTLAALLLWPGAGLLPKDAMKTTVDLSPAFFLAGIYAVSATAAHVGLDSLTADALIPRLGLGGGNLHDLYAVFGLSTLLSHLTTAPAAPVVLAPLAGALAEATGWTLDTVGMVQIVGISTPLLPYQAPPLIVAMALAHIPVPALTRLCLVLTAGVLLIGLPLTHLWWQALGLY